MKKKILICDDHPLIIDGLRFAFNNHPDFEITRGVNSLKSVSELIANILPDILLLDINICGQNGLEEISNIKSRHPQLKIIVFTSYNLPSLVNKALLEGAVGYILKDTGSNDLSLAFYRVLAGEVYVGPGVKFKNERTYFTENEKGITPEADEITLKHILSERELEVFQLILYSYTEQKIAEELHISKHTVHSHRKSILKKLNLKNNTEVIKYAFEHHLMPNV